MLSARVCKADAIGDIMNTNTEALQNGARRGSKRIAMLDDVMAVLACSCIQLTCPDEVVSEIDLARLAQE